MNGAPRSLLLSMLSLGKRGRGRILLVNTLLKCPASQRPCWAPERKGRTRASQSPLVDPRHSEQDHVSFGTVSTRYIRNLSLSPKGRDMVSISNIQRSDMEQFYFQAWQRGWQPPGSPDDTDCHHHHPPGAQWVMRWSHGSLSGL